MELTDMTFTNRLGTITFHRCLLGITDDWRWNGSAPQHFKQVQVDATVFRNEVTPEGFEAILSASGGERGNWGQLTLPWGRILKGVGVQSIEYPSNNWQQAVPVTVTFSDEFPDENKYTLTFFGLELHNPRLKLPIPVRPLKDEFPQMQMFMGNVMPTWDWSLGYLRQRSGYRMMEITLTGTTFVPVGGLPADLIARLCQRRNDTTDPNPGIDYFCPSGYPRPFRLGEAIPELDLDYSLAGVFVAGSQVVWNVEQQQAQINVRMLCQPQRIEV